MKNVARTTAALVLGLACSIAQALPVFSFKSGFESYAGPIEIKFQNFENVGFFGVGESGLGTNFDLAPGATVSGVLRVTSIETPGGDSLWSAGDHGAYLSGVFNQKVISVTPLLSGGSDYTVGAANFDLYLNPIALNAQQGLTGFAAAGGGCAVGQLCYNTVSNVVGGGLFLSLVGTPGILPLDLTNPTFDGNVAATYPTTGDFNGFLNVTGGAYRTRFDTDGQTTPFGTADFFASGTLCPNNSLGGPNTCGPVSGSQTVNNRWQLISNDPVRGNFIPEPGVIALLGVLAVGFAGTTRRRKA